VLRIFVNLNTQHSTLITQHASLKTQRLDWFFCMIAAIGIHCAK